MELLLDDFHLVMPITRFPEVGNILVIVRSPLLNPNKFNCVSVLAFYHAVIIKT